MYLHLDNLRRSSGSYCESFIDTALSSVTSFLFMMNKDVILLYGEWKNQIGDNCQLREFGEIWMRLILSIGRFDKPNTRPVRSLTLHLLQIAFPSCKGCFKLVFRLLSYMGRFVCLIKHQGVTLRGVCYRVRFDFLLRVHGFNNFDSTCSINNW